jgi:hypothetical protein
MSNAPASPSDALRPIRELKEDLHALLMRVRTAEPHTADPEARALMEAAAEVLSGLERACEGYERRTPPAPQAENPAQAATESRQAAREKSEWTDHLEGIPPGLPD